MKPFLDLKAQYESIKAEIDEAVERVLRSGQFVLGEEVEAFEKEFSAYSQAAFGLGTSSGTSALHLALLAAGVGPGDEVITVPFTFAATVSAICQTGARPVFVDIDPDTMTLDAGKLETVLSERTRVILPVHLYGQSAKMGSILDIAEKRGLCVIEDASQAHGATWSGRKVGSFGAMACFSFYPGKNLGACGEAGMVVTSDPGYAETIKILRDQGQSGKGNHVRKGFNYRMDGIQGAILRVKLRYLDRWIESRRQHARTYDRELAGLPLRLPQTAGEAGHVFHIYAIRSPERDRLRRELAERGIPTAVHYDKPVHLQEAYRDLGSKEGEFPESESAAREVFSLPLYPELKDREVLAIAAEVRAVTGRGAAL